MSKRHRLDIGDEGRKKRDRDRDRDRDSDRYVDLGPEFLVTCKKKYNNRKPCTKIYAKELLGVF